MAIPTQKARRHNWHTVNAERIDVDDIDPTAEIEVAIGKLSDEQFVKLAQYIDARRYRAAGKMIEIALSKLDSSV